MKTRTCFKLCGRGIVYCTCGTLGDFVSDINDFILPILEDKIVAEFNEREITVYAYDTVERIYQRFWDVLNGK